MRPAGAVLALFLLTGCVYEDRVDADQTVLYAAYYDLEVLSYCSLGSEAATAGHERTVSRLLANGMSRDSHEQARMEAWADAYREWLNRGLGGFKAWCAGDGEEARSRLENAP